MTGFFFIARYFGGVAHYRQGRIPVNSVLMRAPPIPSSLKWLIDLRARTAGEIDRLKLKESQRIQFVEAEFAGLESKLQRLRENTDAASHAYINTLHLLENELIAIDTVLSQHELAIGPELISPIQSHVNTAPGDHGAMTRAIFESFRVYPLPSLSTTQIVGHVLTRLGLQVEGQEAQDYRLRIRKRMRTLVAEDKLTRLHHPKSTLEGRWRLPTTPAKAVQSSF